MFQSADKKIQEQLNLWNFDAIEILYEKKLDSLENEYIDFLFQIGKFEKLHNFLKVFQETPAWWEMTRISKDYNFFSFREKLSQAVQFDFKDMSFEKRYLACYILNAKISKQELNGKFCHELFYTSIVYMERNKYKWGVYKEACDAISTAYYIKKSIDYFFYSNDDDFLDRIQDYMFILQDFMKQNFYGASICYEQISYLLRMKKLSITYSSPNIAVLVTGAIRGKNWLESLDFLKNQIINPLNADVFLFSWNKKMLWPSIRNRSNWVYRRIPEVYNNTPEQIKNFNEFTKCFPNVYNKLSEDFSIPFSKDELEQLNVFFNDIYLEDEKSFIVCHQKCGELNNLHKMLYGRKIAFELMEEYEKRFQKKYDFVLIVRPDLDYPRIDSVILEKINIGNVIATHELWPHHKEVLDYFFMGNREVIKKICDIWDAIQDTRLDFFRDSFRKDFHAQEALHKWLVFNNIKSIEPHFAYNINVARSISSKSICFPNLQDELQKDILNLKKQNYSSDIIEQNTRFFSDVVQFYGQVNICENDLLDRSRFYSAKARVQNHLAYKLGQAMIIYSKSIFGYLKMPYILNKVYKKHQIEVKEYNEKIKTMSFLKIPSMECCEDYEEALKEKQCLTYRLGEELIKANKSKYKLGYINFFINTYKSVKKFNSYQNKSSSK
ncbi:capsular biosynthesis protein [Campylobacter jejuni]|nr:capsular biosynthesis protein [Campylobacter jejuni]EAL2038088.1 capsular biosynthesis protein [Campylobacter jejuni]EBD1887621.1 capsular biosynthesis protein [Campylobacter jejuni]ECO6926939.1 capsular biosynthesis protein [Campylobacter jejuni]EDP4020605.1 capsular biosynthesis protein [Campylobacter jejuni]